MAIYLIFDSTSGRIQRQLETTDADTLTYNVGIGQGYVEHTEFVDDTIVYITNPLTSKNVTTRPLLTTVASWDTLSIVANGVTAATLGSGLPNPSTIRVSVPPGATQVGSLTETSGSFSLTTTYAGKYDVVAESFPYQNYTVTITAS